MPTKPTLATRDGLCWYDAQAAAVAVAFFEKLLHHVKGEWSGQSFNLQGWQRDEIIKPLFGWKRADGSRRYRRAYIEIPRKNGKSTPARHRVAVAVCEDDEQARDLQHSGRPGTGHDCLRRG